MTAVSSCDGFTHGFSGDLIPRFQAVPSFQCTVLFQDSHENDTVQEDVHIFTSKHLECERMGMRSEFRVAISKTVTGLKYHKC